jgi:DME family drug/metabolite transporter
MLERLVHRIPGPLWVGLAAFLWATDALVRYPSISSIDPSFIVLFEHCLAILLLAPTVIKQGAAAFRGLRLSGWLAAILSGLCGSAGGTILFTASFRYINPSVAVLLQKLQPVFVVAIAALFLRERPTRRFYAWATLALLAAAILSFPDLNFHFLIDQDPHSIGVQYALGAALLWAGATVTGKKLLEQTSAQLATFWRFFFGWIGMLAFYQLADLPIDSAWLTHSSHLIPLFYLSLIPGIFAIYIYYVGLARTPASVTSFIELIYPIGAIALNTLILQTPLEPTQLLAGGVLILSVAQLSGATHSSSKK